MNSFPFRNTNSKEFNGYCCMKNIFEIKFYHAIWIHLLCVTPWGYPLLHRYKQADIWRCVYGWVCIGTLVELQREFSWHREFRIVSSIRKCNNINVYVNVRLAKLIKGFLSEEKRKSGEYYVLWSEYSFFFCDCFNVVYINLIIKGNFTLKAKLIFP